ncbi:hypothetical protein KY359_06725 [Candidatus Woesearchaeota archaeon]|nr:hypothetical protein [Candidatus Woesearchaeota archaeon]
MGELSDIFHLKQQLDPDICYVLNFEAMKAAIARCKGAHKNSGGSNGNGSNGKFVVRSEDDGFGGRVIYCHEENDDYVIEIRLWNAEESDVQPADAYLPVEDIVAVALRQYEEETDQCSIQMTPADDDWETDWEYRWGLDFDRPEPRIPGFEDVREKTYWSLVEKAAELEAKGDKYRAAQLYKKAGHDRIAGEVFMHGSMTLEELRAGIMWCRAMKAVKETPRDEMILYPDHDPYDKWQNS